MQFDHPSTVRRRRLPWLPRLALIAALATFLMAVVWKAWICDDAFITVRTADNWARGLGPTWNAAERVQAYTHPLWFFLVAAAGRLTHEFAATTIILGLLLSTATVLLVAFRAAPNLAAACLSVAILAASRAFTDYSTAGLENPLVHVLLVLFACALLDAEHPSQEPHALAVLLGLVLVTRLDAGLLLLPAAVMLVARHPRSIASWVPGLLPFVLWEGFSLVYYGVLIPNSAYAKLETGLGLGELLPRGLHYLKNSWVQDPVTLTATGAGIAVAALRGSRRAAALGAGAFLYVAYVASVGGDFMSGRFLTAPLLLATVVLARSVPAGRVTWAAVVVVASSIVVPRTSPFGTRDYGPHWDAAIDASGVADERTFYVRGASLRTSRKLHPWPQPTVAGDASYLKREDNWRREPFLNTLHRVGLLEPGWPPADRSPAGGGKYVPVVIYGAVGCMGYYLGPRIHVLDYHGLGDPLLARLPAVVPDPLLEHLMPRIAPARWRAGHYARRIPAGYPETLATGENHIRDPDLAHYYDLLCRVTRGPLLGASRWRAIWELQTGQCGHLLDRYLETQDDPHARESREEPLKPLPHPRAAR